MIEITTEIDTVNKKEYIIGKIALNGKIFILYKAEYIGNKLKMIK